jgi:hypothetical protein
VTHQTNSRWCFALQVFASAFALGAVSPAIASGEANASIISKYYFLRVSSGYYVLPKSPPRPTACKVLSHFEREERMYLHRVGPYLPRITEIVESWRGRLGLAPYDPGLPFLPYGAPRRNITGEALERQTAAVSEAKRWFAGARGRAVLVEATASIREPDGGAGPQIALVLAVPDIVQGERIDQLAAEVAGAIGPAPATGPATGPAVDGERYCQGQQPQPWPKTMVQARQTEVTRRDYQLFIDRPAAALDAAHAAWWDAGRAAHIAGIEAKFVAEVKSHATELSLPFDWPNSSLVPPSPKGSSEKFSFTYFREAEQFPRIGFTVPLARKLPEETQIAISRKLDRVIGPPNLRAGN